MMEPRYLSTFLYAVSHQLPEPRHLVFPFEQPNTSNFIRFYTALDPPSFLLSGWLPERTGRKGGGRMRVSRNHRAFGSSRK